MKELLLILALAHGTDAASTVAALHTGAHEANPIMGWTQRPSLVVGQIAAGAVLENILLRHLTTHHPTLAKTLGMVSFVASGTATAYNVGQVQVARSGGR